MEKLRQYLRGLPRDGVSRYAFAAAAGTTMNYIRKTMSEGGAFGVEICAGIEDATDGAVMASDLRPDLDWDGFAERHCKRLQRAKLKAQRETKKAA